MKPTRRQALISFAVIGACVLVFGLWAWYRQAYALERLFWAIARGNVAAVHSISRDVDVNEIVQFENPDAPALFSKSEKTPLMFAAQTGDPRIVKALLEAGADPDLAAGKGGHTALHYAVEAPGRLEALRVLIDHGADIDAGRSTPLATAFQWAELDAVRILLDAGAQVNAKGTFHLAVYTNDLRRVSLALEYGADVGARDGAGMTPLMWVSGTACMQRLIAAGADLEARDQNGRTVLVTLADMANEELVLALIEAGGDVNAVDHDGKTALMFAVGYGLVDGVRALLAAGADPNARDRDGRAPLMLIAWEGGDPADIADALLANGADVTAADSRGWTVLRHLRSRHTGLDKVIARIEREVEMRDRAP